MTTTIEELATLPALHTTDVITRRDPLESERGVEATIYVTATELDAHAELVGTFQTAVGSWAGDGWLERQDGHRVYGAPLDPEPVNGHHYRVLGGFVVRFNEHAEDRHNPDHPFSVVGGVNGAPWPFPNDSTSTLENAHYVEIEWEVSTGQQEDASAGVDNSTGGVILGLGKETGGVVALDPARVSGRQYLLWADGGDPGNAVLAATFLGDPDIQPTEGWHVEGGYLRSGDGQALRFTTDRYYVPAGTLHWAELALVIPEPSGEDAATAAAAELRRKITEQGGKWESFDEALNELATDKGWCEEFEEIVKPFGLSGRTARYDVEVRVQFTMEDDGPSGGMDRRLSDEYDLSIEASNITIEATATVTIYGLTLRDPGNASEEISTSDVEDALDNAMSGASVSSVNDWSVTDWTPADD